MTRKEALPLGGTASRFLGHDLASGAVFSITEGSALQASVGKRFLKLQVLDTQRQRLSFGDSLKRNAMKFLPWELGHLGAQQLFYAGDANPPYWVWVPLIAAI